MFGRGNLTGAELGCLKSHRNVLLKTDSELTLILEDDFELCENFDAELKKCLAELPEGWEALWLGGKALGKVEKHSEHLNRISRTTGTYGYIVHHSFIPALLSELNKEMELADYAMSRVFKNVFRSKIDLVKHKAGFSIIRNKVV